jgi:endoglycosylceramidase
MFWEKVAEYFANETVLGYEIINEPFGTSLYTSLKEFLIPGITNNKYLIPFYRKVHKSIRKHDNRTILFYE